MSSHRTQLVGWMSVALAFASCAASCDGRTEFLRQARPLCEAAVDAAAPSEPQGVEVVPFGQPTPPPAPEPTPFAAPLCTLLKDHDEDTFRLGNLLPGEVQDAEDVQTLVCITESQSVAGTYTDGAKAYEHRWDVGVVAWPDGTVLHRKLFYGSEPPSSKTGVGGVSGSRPDDEFKSRISSVFSE